MEHLRKADGRDRRKKKHTPINLSKTWIDWEILSASGVLCVSSHFISKKRKNFETFAEKQSGKKSTVGKWAKKMVFAIKIDTGLTGIYWLLYILLEIECRMEKIDFDHSTPRMCSAIELFMLIWGEKSSPPGIYSAYHIVDCVRSCIKMLLSFKRTDLAIVHALRQIGELQSMVCWKVGGGKKASTNKFTQWKMTLLRIREH